MAKTYLPIMTGSLFIPSVLSEKKNHPMFSYCLWFRLYHIVCFQFSGPGLRLNNTFKNLFFKNKTFKNVFVTILFFCWEINALPKMLNLNIPWSHFPIHSNGQLCKKIRPPNVGKAHSSEWSILQDYGISLVSLLALYCWQSWRFKISKVTKACSKNCQSNLFLVCYIIDRNCY